MIYFVGRENIDETVKLIFLGVLQNKYIALLNTKNSQLLTKIEVLDQINISDSSAKLGGPFIKLRQCDAGYFINTE